MLCARSRVFACAPSWNRGGGVLADSCARPKLRNASAEEAQEEHRPPEADRVARLPLRGHLLRRRQGRSSFHHAYAAVAEVEEPTAGHRTSHAAQDTEKAVQLLMKRIKHRNLTPTLLIFTSAWIHNNKSTIRHMFVTLPENTQLNAQRSHFSTTRTLPDLIDLVTFSFIS